MSPTNMYNSMEVDIDGPFQVEAESAVCVIRYDCGVVERKDEGWFSKDADRPDYPQERLRKDERVVGRAERACLQTCPPAVRRIERTRTRRNPNGGTGSDTDTAGGLPAPNSGSAGMMYSAIRSTKTTIVERSNSTPCDTFHSLNETNIDKPTSILAAT